MLHNCLATLNLPSVIMCSWTSHSSSTGLNGLTLNDGLGWFNLMMNVLLNGLRDRISKVLGESPIF